MQILFCFFVLSLFRHHSLQFSMADKKKLLDKAVVVEFKISMHCKACERSVAKVISKFKGVETFSTDMKKHRIIIKGRMDPEKVMKKLKKKTGKKVEIVKPNDTSKSNAGTEDSSKRGSGPNPNSLVLDDWRESAVLFTMFSDENPNACSIM